MTIKKMKMRMKNKSFVIGIIIVISISILCIFGYLGTRLFKRFSLNILDGTPGISKSISESKSRNVFIASIEINDDSSYHGLSLLHLCKEVWLEKTWVHGSYDNPTELLTTDNHPQYSLCIRPNKIMLDSIVKHYGGLRTNWAILISNKSSFITSGVDSNLVFATYYVNVPSQPDTLFAIKCNMPEIINSPEHWIFPNVLGKATIRFHFDKSYN
jgi:hypothetical protein